jgi:hypothetical protein
MALASQVEAPGRIPASWKLTRRGCGWRSGERLEDGTR